MSPGDANKNYTNIIYQNHLFLIYKYFAIILATTALYSVAIRFDLIRQQNASHENNKERKKKIR